MALANGFKIRATINAEYKSGSKLFPYLHFVMTRTDFNLSESEIGITQDWISRLEGLRGYQAVRSEIAHFAAPGDSILDPCCGKGDAARVAIEIGMRFFGNELNSKRLDETISRLQKDKVPLQKPAPNVRPF